MSNLIEMPSPQGLSGRMLMLNLEVAKRFQCPGFALSPNQPYLTVPDLRDFNPSTHEAMNAALQRGLLDGRLIDVTGQDVKGLKVGGNEHTAVVTEDTGEKVFMGTDSKGNLYIVTPKSKEDEEAILQEILKTGTINRAFERAAAEQPEESAFTGLTGITVEEAYPTPTVILTDPE
jgi:hypothetical protein